MPIEGAVLFELSIRLNVCMYKGVLITLCIIRLPDCLHKLLMIEIKRKKKSNVFVIVLSGSLITPSCEDYKV